MIHTLSFRAGVQDAVQVDRNLRTGRRIMLKGESCLHCSLKPLDEVDLRNAEGRGQKAIAGAVLRRAPFERNCLRICGV